MICTFYLIRHGQTDWNIQGFFQGQQDIPLNATGLSQAEETAAKLVGMQFDAIYSSDLTRAIQTAEIIAENYHLPVLTDARLREIHQGEWEGLLYRDVVREQADHMEKIKNDPIKFGPPGGETAGIVARRVQTCLDDLCARHPGGHIIVVSHGMTIATALCLFRDFPLQRAASLIPDNVSINVIEWGA